MAEIHEYANDTAKNIWSKVKEMGYSAKQANEDDAYEEQEEGEEEEEEQEEEVVNQESREQEPMEEEEEEEEEVIHMYSDEGESNDQLSRSILDLNYV